MGHQHVDEDEFAERFWSFPLFVDEDKKFYNLFSFGRTTWKSGWGLFDSQAIQANREANSRKIDGNLKGDGPQLGGTIVLRRDGTVLYVHAMKGYGDNASIDDIIATVKSA